MTRCVVRSGKTPPDDALRSVLGKAHRMTRCVAIGERGSRGMGALWPKSLKIDQFLTPTDQNPSMDRPIFNTLADRTSHARQPPCCFHSGRMPQLSQCGQGDRSTGGP